MLIASFFPKRFIQKSSPNIKGVKFPEFRVYHQNKVKYVKINANIYRNCWDIIGKQ